MPARERPLTHVRAISKIGPLIGLDLKFVRREKETRFEGCGLRKRDKNERKKDVEGGRNRHETLQRNGLQQETRPVEACLLH